MLINDTLKVLRDGPKCCQERPNGPSRPANTATWAPKVPSGRGGGGVGEDFGHILESPMESQNRRNRKKMHSKCHFSSSPKTLSKKIQYAAMEE